MKISERRELRLVEGPPWTIVSRVERFVPRSPDFPAGKRSSPEPGADNASAWIHLEVEGDRPYPELEECMLPDAPEPGGRPIETRLEADDARSATHVSTSDKARSPGPTADNRHSYADRSSADLSVSAIAI